MPTGGCGQYLRHLRRLQPMAEAATADALHLFEKTECGDFINH